MTGPGGIDADRPAFDPRHDARFQRGYQSGDAPSAPDRRERIGAPPATPATASAVPENAFDGLVGLAYDGEAFPDELESPRRNPFIAVLWAVGILFVIASLALQWQAATNSYANFAFNGNGPLPLGMVIQQLSYSIAPSVLFVGLGILAGLLFWHASAWRARRAITPAD